jgi:hypothetical protein
LLSRPSQHRFTPSGEGTHTGSFQPAWLKLDLRCSAGTHAIPALCRWPGYQQLSLGPGSGRCLPGAQSHLLHFRCGLPVSQTAKQQPAAVS